MAMARVCGPFPYSYIRNFNASVKKLFCINLDWLYNSPLLKLRRSMATESNAVVKENTEVDVNEPVKLKLRYNYKEAVMALNSLQSNAETIRKAMQNRSEARKQNIPNMINYLNRVGLTLDDVDGLNVIHVSGTKGKGSTCAFSESILRKYGYKTGLYSSPHLIEVRERIRIGGQPISCELFSSSFWHVFEKLQATKDVRDGGMPHYFSFLTVMALYVFVQEKVDVAVIEVGIGGQYDSTNVVPHPVVCGIASLDFDHTNLLGHTLEQIAWHKAGIFKSGTPACTVQQPDSAMQVILCRAVQMEIPLSVAVPLEQNSLGEQSAELGIAGSRQFFNAGLAIQLCQTWLTAYSLGPDLPVSKPCRGTSIADIPVQQIPHLTQQMISGLRECRWPGRNQTVHGKGVTYYLDGAHTPDSIKQCVEWFRDTAAKEEAQLEQLQMKVLRALVFNMTGDRPVATLLAELQVCDFDRAAFCPNLAFTTASDNIPDQLNMTVEQEAMVKKSKAFLDLWNRLKCVPAHHQMTEAHNGGSSSIFSGFHHDDAGPIGNMMDGGGCVSASFPCITSALQWACRSCPATHIQILVTGSLHLVGGALELIASNSSQ